MSDRDDLNSSVLDDLETLSAAGEAAYYAAAIAEARAIVAGESDAEPQAVHLFALLNWLTDEAPFEIDEHPF